MAWRLGYLNDEYDERLEKLQSEYLDIFDKSMSEYTKKDWARFDEYSKRSDELIKIIHSERKKRDRITFVETKKSKKKK